MIEPISECELGSLRPGDLFHRPGPDSAGVWMVTDHEDLDDTYCVLCVRLGNGHTEVIYKAQTVYSLPIP